MTKKYLTKLFSAHQRKFRSLKFVNQDRLYFWTNFYSDLKKITLYQIELLSIRLKCYAEDNDRMSNESYFSESALSALRALFLSPVGWEGRK